jgi:recombination protein RecA
MAKEEVKKSEDIKIPGFISNMMDSYNKQGVTMEGGRVVCDFFDTGNIALNFNLSGNFDAGWPSGQVIIISGDPSTGKSLLMKHAMAEFLKKYKNGVVVLDDTENAYVDYLGSDTGIDQSRFVRISTDSVEEHSALVFDGIKDEKTKKVKLEPIVPKLAGAGIKDILVVVDSIAAWSTEHELEVGLSKTDMSKPKVLKALFRVIKNDIKKFNVTYMVTNHLIWTIGDMFTPSKKIEPGGGGPAFQASVRLCLALAAKIKEKGSENVKKEDNNIVGILTKAQTQKNRFAPPFRTTELKIFFDRGVDR